VLNKHNTVFALSAPAQRKFILHFTFFTQKLITLYVANVSSSGICGAVTKVAKRNLELLTKY